jgi:hypothetical protein
MLIKGTNLTEKQIKLITSGFIYRWTIENTQRESAWKTVECQPTIPLQTDREWLNDHAFYFVKDWSRLSKKLGETHCEPHYMAD